jgi:HEAT repeat protein
MALVYSESEWEVFLRDGLVMVTPPRAGHTLTPRPPFQPYDADYMDPSMRDAYQALKVDDGWLVGFNRGEFGASLWWYSADGKDKVHIGRDQVSLFMQLGDSIYALEGLAHLGGNNGSICRLARDKDGKWASEPFVILNEMPEAALLDRDGTMIVVTTDSVVKVWPSGKMRLLVHSDWVYPNSAARAADGTLYIGMRGAVVQVSDLEGSPKVTVIERSFSEEHAREAKAEGVLSSIAEGLKSPDENVRIRALRAVTAASSGGTSNPYEETFINTPTYDIAVLAAPALKDPSPEVRLEAARLLAAQPHSEAAAALGEALNDSDEAVATAAAVSLGRLGAGGPFLADALGSSRSAVAVQAARSLGGLGSAARDALPALRAAAADSQPEVAAAARQALADIGKLAEPDLGMLTDPAASTHNRCQSAHALGRLGMVSDRVLPAPLAAMKDKVADVRRAACTALAELGPAAAADSVPALIAAFKDPVDPTPEVAAEDLARLEPASCPGLIEALQSDDVVVRRLAARALYWMGKKATPAAAALTAALDDKAAAVRAQAADALAQIGPAASSAIPRLIALLDDPDKATRKAATDALAGTDPARTSVVQALRKVLRDPDPGVRWHAVGYLQFLEPVPPEVVPVLIDALNDADESVTTRAAEALRQIRPPPAAAIPALVRALERLVAGEAASGAGKPDPFDGNGRYPVIEALGRFGPAAAPAVPALIKAFRCENVSLRMASARALGAIGPSAADAAEDLRHVLDSRDLRLILVAEEALKAIQAAHTPGD